MEFEKERFDRISPEASRDISLLQAGVPATTVALGALREATLSPGQIRELSYILENARSTDLAKQQLPNLSPIERDSSSSRVERLEGKVNNIDILMYWDNGYQSYVLHLPQLDQKPHEELVKRGVEDSVLRLEDSTEPGIAFKVASLLAHGAKDPCELMERLIKDLPNC